MLQVKQFVFNHFQTNCYLLWDDLSKVSAVIDPCAETESESAKLDLFITQNSLNLSYILLTHAHIDHIVGIEHIADKYQVPVVTHADSRYMLDRANAYADLMGFAAPSFSHVRLQTVSGGDTIQLGNELVECRYVPGHCIGSLCFVTFNPKLLFSGDALFHGSIGRTDLPGGDHDTLISKIHSELLTLDDSYMLLPGHGDCSSIDEEKSWNPFL